MFYEFHTLNSSSEKGSWFAYNLPKQEDIIKRIRESKSTYFSSIPNLEEWIPEIHIIYQGNLSDTANVHLRLNYKGSTITLCSVTLTTVNYNCGAIHISNLYTEEGHGCGFSWDLLDLVERWCKWAGYTMVFGNTAGSYQNQLVPRFEKLGYTKMGVDYINSRSRNRNIWLQKILIDQDTLVEEPNDDYDEEEDI